MPSFKPLTLSPRFVLRDGVVTPATADTLVADLRAIAGARSDPDAWYLHESADAIEQQAREADSLRQRLEDWENREATCCPEDFGFVEYIASLRQ